MYPEMYFDKHSCYNLNNGITVYLSKYQNLFLKMKYKLYIVI